MKRFIFFFVIGSLMIAGSQIVLSLGLHPEHLASLRILFQGSLGLALGSAVAVTGLLGLAEGYEKIALQLNRLLGTRRVGDGLETAVQTSADLAMQNHSFWRAYQKSALAVCLFLAGTLGLAMALARTRFILYLVGLSLGMAVLGLLAVGLGLQALRRMRRAHRAVEQSAHTLDQQPELSAEPPVPLSPQPAIQWTRRGKFPTSSRYHPSHRQAAQTAIRR